LDYYQEGGADTANIIKPHLARWDLSLIWATTFDEYKKYIEKDPALTRRFQIVKIEEPTEKWAIKLLEWIKYRFEDFHGVNISSWAVETAVRLSKRYILDKQLPDKAIDLLDEACSRVWEKAISKNITKKIDELNKQIEDLEKKIEKSVAEQDYFSAADYKEKISNLKQDILKLQTTDDTPREKRQVITEEDIEKVIVEKYWISSSVLSKSEIEFLKDLKNKLNKEIIWQEQAVNDVVNAIIRNKLSPLEKTKPIWSFLFLWASWVGKTYLANLLAKYFFQDENALIKINMSEYSENISSSKLTWSAPGYVGYEEWWLLTEAVRKKPYSVILFDEIEKWSSSVLNILLQILDNWYLEDNKWRKIDFKNTIIILTSNLWSEYFTKQVTKIWFDLHKDKGNWLTKEREDMILNEVKNVLPVELLNRFDKIVYFNNINVDLLKKVFQKYYKEYKQLWKKQKWISIPTINKDEMNKIVENIEKEWAWVRWVEKYIYNELENKIIEKML
jgi:ATP-dependent Clp protease ATP-binding subunit ClpC